MSLICRYCNKVYQRKDFYDKHVLACGNDYVENSEVDRTEQETKEASKGNEHTSSSDSRAANGVMKCSNCEKVYVMKHHFEKHVLICELKNKNAVNMSNKLNPSISSSLSKTSISCGQTKKMGANANCSRESDFSDNQVEDEQEKTGASKGGKNKTEPVVAGCSNGVMKCSNCGKIYVMKHHFDKHVRVCELKKKNTLEISNSVSLNSVLENKSSKLDSQFEQKSMGTDAFCSSENADYREDEGIKRTSKGGIQQKATSVTLPTKGGMKCPNCQKVYVRKDHYDNHVLFCEAPKKDDAYTSKSLIRSNSSCSSKTSIPCGQQTALTNQNSKINTKTNQCSSDQVVDTFQKEINCEEMKCDYCGKIYKKHRKLFESHLIVCKANFLKNAEVGEEEMDIEVDEKIKKQIRGRMEGENMDFEEISLIHEEENNQMICKICGTIYENQSRLFQNHVLKCEKSLVKRCSNSDNELRLSNYELSVQIKKLQADKIKQNHLAETLAENKRQIEKDELDKYINEVENYNMRAEYAKQLEQEIDEKKSSLNQSLTDELILTDNISLKKKDIEPNGSTSKIPSGSKVTLRRSPKLTNRNAVSMSTLNTELKNSKSKETQCIICKNFINVEIIAEHFQTCFLSFSSDNEENIVKTNPTREEDQEDEEDEYYDLNINEKSVYSTNTANSIESSNSNISPALICTICKQRFFKDQTTEYMIHSKKCLNEIRGKKEEINTQYDNVNEDFSLINIPVLTNQTTSTKLDLIITRLTELTAFTQCLIENDKTQQKNIEILLSKFNFDLTKKINFERPLKSLIEVRNVSTNCSTKK